MKSPFKILLLSCCVLAASLSHAIEKQYPLIKYECDSSTDTILVTNSLLKAEDGESYQYSPQEGTYSPWNMVEISHEPDSTRIVNSSKVINTCKLSSGEYTVTLEPQIFSRNLEGQCGASISGAVTVVLNETEVLQRTAFETYCHGNAPVITRIKVYGKTKDYRIKRVPRYRYY